MKPSDWTEAQNNLLDDMMADDRSYSDIADALGKSRNSVICRWRKVVRSMGWQAA